MNGAGRGGVWRRGKKRNKTRGLYDEPLVVEGALATCCFLAGEEAGESRPGLEVETSVMPLLLLRSGAITIGMQCGAETRGAMEGTVVGSTLCPLGSGGSVLASGASFFSSPPLLTSSSESETDKVIGRRAVRVEGPDHLRDGGGYVLRERSDDGGEEAFQGKLGWCLHRGTAIEVRGSGKKPQVETRLIIDEGGGRCEPGVIGKFEGARGTDDPPRGG